MRLLIAGATGLVGRACLHQAIDDPFFERIVVITRRPLRREDGAPSVESHLVDFDRLESEAAALRAEAVLCALGTTMRQARSRSRFRAVDYGYVVMLARLALAQGARHFLLVSSLGANPASWNFYSRVKGEVEQAVSLMPYRSVSIFRPSVLLGERGDFRFGEELMKRIALLMPGRYRAIQASEVAAAMIRVVKEDQPGRRVIESADIRSLAGR